MIFLTEYSSKVSVLHITHFILFLKKSREVTLDTTKYYKNLLLIFKEFHMIYHNTIRQKKSLKLGSGVCMHTI